MSKITEEEIQKILPEKGPSFEEVKKYLDKYNKEYIVIKCGGSVLVDPKLFKFFIEDVAVLKKYLNIDCEPVYCTKIVSKLVRTYTDKHGLKDLCKELINIDLSKQQQSSNWGARELTEDQKLYAASDVLYLHQIKDILDQELLKLNRRDIADQCFSFIKTRVDLDLKGWPDIDIFSH